MEDIVVLALLPRADHEILSHIWGTGKVKARLLELTRRYALITEGDLHESVRSFLRQRWRGEERPECLPAVIKKLETAISIPPWKTGDPEYFDAATLWLNFLSWNEGSAFLAQFAPSLTLALAFDADCTGLLNLVLEIREPAKEFRSLRVMLERLLESRRALWLSEPWGTNEVLAWLEREARAGDWGQVERGALALLSGLKQAREEHSVRALRNLEEADGVFGEHLPRKSEAGEAAQTIGLKLLEERKWVDAETAFGLQGDLNYLVSYATNALAIAKTYRRQLNEAERLFRRAAEMDPIEPLFLRNLGRLLRQGRRWEEAAKAYDEALTVNPDDAATLNGLALLHQERRPTPDCAEAERLFRRAAEIDPTEPDYLRNLGDLMRENRRWEEAAKAYEQNLTVNPDDSATLNSLALLHQERRPTPDLVEAARLFRRAAEINPSNPLYLRNLGHLLRDNQRWEEAATAYEQNLTLHPDDARTVNGLALLHQQRHPTPDLAEAERLFRRAAEIDPTEPEYLLKLANLLLDQDRTLEADESFKQILEGGTPSADSYNSIAWSLFVHGHQLRDALTFAAQATELDPETPAFRHTYVDICLRLRLPNAMDAAGEWISRCDPEFFDTYRADTVATFATLLKRENGPQLLALLHSHGNAPAWSKWISALRAVLRPETATALDESARELFEAIQLSSQDLA
jgi:tetratricopeptide (TPR) repeat protein